MCAWRGTIYNGGPYIWNNKPIPPEEPLVDCFDYSKKSCCNSSESEYFKEQFATAVQFFAGCPACVHNLHTIWCAYDCDPYQATYVSTEPKTNGAVYKTANFSICRRFAKKVYESCQWVHFVRSMWPTYEIFWETQANRVAPRPITIIYPEDDNDPNTYCPMDKIQRCEDYCDCISCPPGCESTNDVKYKDNSKKIGKLSQFQFWCVMIGSIIALFAFIALVIGIKNRIQNSKSQSQSGYSSIN
ncbi:npc intracellular cholesterol transporter 1 [Anaeramoeba flamelloides]|uniref:Npc intracellular cholesterol transporter n=1 Tax=Anaeramoeba flamelloides TaxID=1746091 RepID=A0AAV7YDI0_9EUKA|nr:npc intracellular cholesterol transporter [Anaeramoeba flamelloides]KAJ6236831.1 npc intracellular cholesterol transporter 1 [Anaeramoeba flamelloides]